MVLVSIQARNADLVINLLACRTDIMGVWARRPCVKEGMRVKKTLMKAALILAASGISGWAQIVDDPLHGYCSVGCSDNGNNSPTSQNPITGFGFTVSPGPATGVSILIDILEPNNKTGITPTITGTDITGSATAALFSGTPFSSGMLDGYLGISASPANPIGGFLTTSGTGNYATVNPGATSFFVYQLSLAPVGGITLQGPSNPNVSPLWNIGSAGLPLGSYIVAFLNEGTAAAPNWIATANSGAILETHDAPPSVPEPSSIILLGTVTLGLVTVLKKNVHSRA